MSIATLKRKTQAKYNNMSVGAPGGFSLNGTHRNQGYVGQTSLSRSLPRTLQQGHGGCCGTYNNVPVVMSSIKSTEDSTTIKRSVLGTSGMISTKYRMTRRPYPYGSVKPDSNNHNVDQNTYITNLRKKTFSEIKKANDPNNTTCLNANVSTLGECNNGKKICSYTRSASEFLPISSGDYIYQLGEQCQENDIIVKRKNQGMPFAC